jgi:hypothetical protein
MMAQQQQAGALTPAAALQYQERLQQLGVQQAGAYQQLSYGWENRLMSTMIGSPGSFNLNGRGFALRDAVLFGGAVNPHFGSNRSNLPFFLQLAGLGNIPSHFPGTTGPFDAPGFGVYGMPGLPGTGGAPVGASGGSGGYGAGGTGPAPDMPGGAPSPFMPGGGPGGGGDAGAYGGLPTGGPAPVGATGGGGGYGPGGAAPAPDMPGGAGSGPAPFNPFAPMLPGESTDEYVQRRDAGFGVTSPHAGHDLGHPTHQIDWTRKGRADAWWADAQRRSWEKAHPPQVPKSQDPGSPDHGGGEKGVEKFEITIKLVGPDGKFLGEGTVTGKPGGTSSTNLGVNGDLWSLLNGMGVGVPTAQ